MELRSLRRSARSRLPAITVRRLLKSWAIPPVSWPTASSRWACISDASARSRISISCSSLRVVCVRLCSASASCFARLSANQAVIKRHNPTANASAAAWEIVESHAAVMVPWSMP